MTDNPDQPSRAKLYRDKRYAARIDINGRLVAVNAKRHGVLSTYTNHGCQCEPCTVAARNFNTPYRRRKRQTDDEFRERANAASRRYTAAQRDEPRS